MIKKENLIVGLLVISLAFNYFVWKELKDLRNWQEIYATGNEVQDLRYELSSMGNDLKNILKQNEWIHESNFEVNKEKSSFATISLQGEWTFKELADKQIPYLSLQEGNNWREIKLDKQSGLTYSVQLQLSPQKQYNYRIFTQGNVSKSTEVRRIPYEKYGLPEVGVKFGSSSSSASPKIEFNFVAILRPGIPIKAMIPNAIYLELVRNGKTEQTIPFSLDDAEGSENIWKANWTLENKKDIREYTLFAIAKYQNGFEQRKQVEHFTDWAKEFYASH